MPLTFCADLSPASWISSSPLPWTRLVGFGPGGFPAYARLRFIPDLAHPGQSEVDVETQPDLGDTEQVGMLLDLLADDTSTPDDCYFCLWEGWAGYLEGSPAIAVGFAGDLAEAGPPPTVAPAFAQEVLNGPKVIVPGRTYLLFRGPLAQAADWGAAEAWPGQPRLDPPYPAFAWPADHAWCVACDVDPHWAGIGAEAAVIERLTREPRLDIVSADPAQDQPAYYE